MDDPSVEVSNRYLQRFFEGSYGDALTHAPTYTTWDDHEFWNNYPHSQIWLDHSKGAKRAVTIREALACLDLYQHSLNVGPNLGIKNRSFTIRDTPLVSIFMADLRTERELDVGGNSRMMDGDGLNDLKAWAKGLKRPGILALGQPLWMLPGDGFDYNPPRFRAQYDAIWKAITNSPFDILILSGDVHHSRLLRLNVKNGDRLHAVYECVTTPANHIPEGSSSVAFPAELDDSHIPGDPRLHNVRDGGYIMGTNSRGTFAVIEIFRDMPNRVGVRIEFRDMLKLGLNETSRIADNQSARVTRKIYRNRTTETTEVVGIGGPLGRNKCQAHPIYLGERI
jgi:hypothetical protein